MATGTLPERLALDDDTLLDHIALEEPVPQPPLRPIEQLAVLAECRLLLASQPQHESTGVVWPRARRCIVLPSHGHYYF